MPATSDNRIDLLREVYNVVAQGVESLEHGDRVGPDLAYLLGAMLNDGACECPPGRAILTILREHFPDGHAVYGFVSVETE